MAAGVSQADLRSAAARAGDTPLASGHSFVTEILFGSLPRPPVFTGEDVTLTAVVRTVPFHELTATGTITFKESGADITGCVNVPMVSSQANCVIPAGTFTAGVKAFTAEYSGDGDHDPSSAAMQPAGFTYVDCAADPIVTTGAVENDGAAGSLRWALQNACAGSVVTFALTDGVEVVVTGDPLSVQRDLTVNGPGIDSAVVRPGAGWFNVGWLFSISGHGVDVTIRDLSIRGDAGRIAGGMIISNATVTLERVLMSGHVTGAIRNGNGTLILRDSTLQGNTSLEGGGIRNGGTATVINSTITGNTAGVEGGGIFNEGGTLTVINSTITNNVTGSAGGGISSPFNFVQPLLYNTIVAGNRDGSNSPNDIHGEFDTGSTANLIGIDTNLIGISHGTNGNLVGSAAAPIDPMLGALADNGGPTPTHRPLDGSPVLDAGRSVVDPVTTAPLATDQRGRPRPTDSVSIVNPAGGNGSDIGAFEAAAVPSVVLPTLHDSGTYNNDGITSVAAPEFDITGVTAGATVELLVDGTPVTSSTAVGTTIQLSAGTLAEGPHSITARQTVAGDLSPTSGTLAIVIDTTAPGVPTIDLDAASDSGASNSDNVTNAASLGFTIGATEAGVAVELLRDLATVGSTAGTGAAVSLTDSTASTSGNVYSFVARQTDVAGNLSVSAALDVFFDNTRPAVTIDSAALSATNMSPIPVTVTFTEDVSGFVAGDLAVSNGTVSNFSGTGANYSFDLVPSGEGAVTVDVAEDAAADPAGNTSTEATRFQRTYDSLDPTATITVTPDPRNTSVSAIDIVFDGPVSGVTLSDLLLTRDGGGNLLTGSQTVTTSDGITWTLDNLASLTGADGSYALTLTAAGSGIADGGGNLLAADAGETWLMDATAPAVTITQAEGQADPTPNVGSVHFTAIFSEPINLATFTNADIDLTAGDATASTILISQIAPNNGTTFDVALSGLTPGQFIAAIQAGAVEDFVGNLSLASSSSDDAVTVLNCLVPSQTVTSIDDSGPGTLRQALMDVCPGGTIDFNLPEDGPDVVFVTSGAMSVDRDLTISGPATRPVTIDGGDASGLLVVAAGVTARIDRLTFANGYSAGEGGALLNFGTVSIFGSVFTSSKSDTNGGAIANEGVMGLANSTISGNRAEGNGGGIFNCTGGVLYLVNATITNNVANDLGGGVYNITSVYVANTILAGNVAVNGGADLLDDAGGVTNNLGHNLIGGDPKIGSLGTYGGITLSHALLAGSPAIDAGDTAIAVAVPLLTDQRGAGFVRLADGPDADSVAVVDIGAFEADPSVEDVPNKVTTENTPFEFTFNVGGTAGPDPIEVVAGGATFPPDVDVVLTQLSPSSWKATVTPKPDFWGGTFAYIEARKTINGHETSMSDLILVTISSAPSGPAITGATTLEDAQTTDGLVLTRNALDGPEITHFKITTITNGTLFKADGVTPIALNAFITAAEGAAGLRFTPAPHYSGIGTIGARASTAASDGGVGGGEQTQTITIAPVADTPGITGAATIVNQQTTNGLVITRSGADGAEVTHFKVTAITGGTLFQHDGVTPIAINAFITVAQGGAGLRFTPNPGSAATGQVSVRASLSNLDSGLGGGSATANVIVTPAGTFSDDPLVAGVTPIRLVHVIELRTRTNAQRVRFGLTAISYTSTQAGVSLITAQDLLQIRTALLQAYAAANRTAPAFTDPSLAPGTVVKAVHIQELRAAILALEAP